MSSNNLNTAHGHDAGALLTVTMRALCSRLRTRRRQRDGRMVVTGDGRKVVTGDGRKVVTGDGRKVVTVTEGRS